MSLGLEGLVAIDNDLKLAPRLAESWSQPDALHYVYKLRPGVKFWDGTPLTVDDVVYSMARHMDPEVGSVIGGAYAHVKSITATGPAEVTVVMREPDPVFQYVPAKSFVTPKALTQSLGKKLGVAGSTVNTMGTGPYRITAFDGDNVSLVRNPNYWGEAGNVERVQFHTISNANDLSLALQSGDVAGVANVPLPLVSSLSRNGKIGLGFPASLVTSFLSFDVTRPPWDDVHVRRAVAHAADTKGYVKTFLGAAGEPAQALPSPAQWASLASPARVAEIYRQIPQYPFDIAAAKRELAQSRHPNGFSATIEFGASDAAVSGKVFVSLSQSLKQIGIDLQVKQVTDEKYLADLYAHSQPLFPLGLSPNAPDPTNFLTVVYPSENARKNALNTANFKNKEVDRLLSEQAATTDKARRATLIGEMLRIAGEELPYLPLWHQSLPLALNKKYVYNGFSGIFYYQNWLANVQVRA